MSVFMAALHHLAAFTLVSTLAVEVALFKPPVSVTVARRLQRTDLIFGVAAVLLLAVGLMRVFWFEKGPRYYWHDLYFLIKFSAFVIAALVSIYPTVTFLAWAPAVKAEQAPTVSDDQIRRVRMCLMLELTAIVIILPCAALMARGFGYLR